MAQQNTEPAGYISDTKGGREVIELLLFLVLIFRSQSRYQLIVMGQRGMGRAGRSEARRAKLRCRCRCNCSQGL